MIPGSVFARVQRERSAQGVQSFRANRASNIMPFSGQVFGSHEMLCLPAEDPAIHLQRGQIAR
ncbi:MAG: hypothetical protein ACREFN_19375, partial [Acetobacteraceae bacterium]